MANPEKWRTLRTGQLELEAAQLDNVIARTSIALGKIHNAKKDLPKTITDSKSRTTLEDARIALDLAITVMARQRRLVLDEIDHRPLNEDNPPTVI